MIPDARACSRHPAVPHQPDTLTERRSPDQLQEHWISYRSAAEALKHERYLYLAKAGPYTGDDHHRVLAERIEGLISQEHAKWAATSRQPTERPTGKQ